MRHKDLTIKQVIKFNTWIKISILFTLHADLKQKWIPHDKMPLYGAVGHFLKVSKLHNFVILQNLFHQKFNLLCI